MASYFKTLGLIPYSDLYYSIHTLQSLHFYPLFLILWGIMTLLAAAKGYWQKNKGFDSTELSWLWAYGARTHFIHSGIRYFSFFTDAGLFGASMGLSCTVFTLTFFYTKNLFLRLFYLIVGMAGFYGLLISGTRSAIAVPIAGLGSFCSCLKVGK